MTPVPDIRKGFFYYSKKFALWYGSGAAVATKMLKSDMVSLPPGWSTYMGYFCGMVIIASCLLAGPAVAGFVRKTSALLKILQNMDTNKKPEDEI